MTSDKNGEERGKGFVVRDKRFSARKEDEEEPQAREEPGKKEPAQSETIAEEQGPLPEITFMNFILSLSTSALIQLGEIQDPVSKEIEKNLPLAKQTIDFIATLKEKTKGNLASEEEKILESLLYDLRMKYVRVAG
jgi:hypothetical protein